MIPLVPAPSEMDGAKGATRFAHATCLNQIAVSTRLQRDACLRSSR
jgi:hypothetical protein